MCGWAVGVLGLPKHTQTKTRDGGKVDLLVGYTDDGGGGGVGDCRMVAGWDAGSRGARARECPCHKHTCAVRFDEDVE